MNKDEIAKQQSDFILYTGNDGNVNVEVFLKDETVWLTQKAMAGLFGVKVPAISKHLANIYETGELKKESTISILETVQNEGNRKVKRKMEFYNLDVIISVGYLAKSLSFYLYSIHKFPYFSFNIRHIFDHSSCDDDICTSL